MFDLSIVLNFFLSIVILAGIYSLGRLHETLKSYANSFGSEYGKIEALTNKLSEVSKQQETLTKITETVKHDIEHKSWTLKEEISLKPKKLEEFVIEYMKDQDNRHLHRDRVFNDQHERLDQSTHIRLKMLIYLYLPELQSEYTRYERAYRQFLKWSADSRALSIASTRSQKTKVKESIKKSYGNLDDDFSQIQHDIFVISNNIANKLKNQKIY
ncbi:hypothetical protein [Alteromonas australica]|uniref:hypothetical protein n=1 Tax=Alteromonas australica TaxID=589873 RepID=UPI0035C7E259